MNNDNNVLRFILMVYGKGAEMHNMNINTIINISISSNINTYMDLLFYVVVEYNTFTNK